MIPQNMAYSLKCGLASFVATYVSGIMHPLDLIKTRFQSHDGKSNIDNQVPRYGGVYRALREIYKTEGFKGLYKGFYVSLLSQALAGAFFFLLYQKRKKDYLNKGHAYMKAVQYSSIEAGLLGTLITQPLWVIRTRMLLNTDPKVRQIQNAVSKTKQIYRQSGWRGFLKGLYISMVLSFSGLVQMYIYEGSKILYERFQIPESGFAQKNFICGSLSKFASVIFTYPLTTIRTRVQQNQYFNNRYKAKYEGLSDVTLRLMRDQGVSGFYKGIVPNLMRGLPQRGIYFYCYQLLKKLFIKDKSKSHQIAQ